MNTNVLAKQIRIHALKMTNIGNSSHIGSVLSAADILAVLYNDVMDVESNNPLKKDRDRFVMSKGHAGAGVYATLAESGFFPVEKLKTHYQNGSDLSGHVSHKGVPGVEFSTGSLGHGLPVAAGMAFAAKYKKEKNRVFTLVSDGECNEGSTWEAIMFAGHQKLDNLIVIVDYNKIQAMGSTEETMDPEPFAEKWKLFGWDALEIDGHDINVLKESFDAVNSLSGKPKVIIAHTVKGKSVSFMENNLLWHYRSAQGQEFENALNELEAIKL